MSQVLQDVRFSLRSLRHSPGLWLAIIVTLALGIGANSAIFAVVYGTVIRPLPYPEEDRLVALHETNDAWGWTAANVAPANFLDWRERSETFEAITSHGWVRGASLTGKERPRWIRITDVHHDFFDVLGVQPMLGRVFGEQATWGAEDVPVVISHGLWRTHFGADPDVIGQRIMIFGRPRNVGAVMPPGFDYPAPEVDVWDAFGWDPESLTQPWFRRSHFISAVGRLRDGATIEQAGAELDAIAEALEDEYPATNEGMRVNVRPLRTTLVGEARTPLLVLLGAVGLVLLVACANIANLLLVRASDRTHEISIRAALGAGRARIARQLFTESLLLASIGGALGTGLGYAFTRLLLEVSAGTLPRLEAIAFDAPVAAFLVSLVAVTGLAFGAGPAWQLARMGRRPDSGESRTSPDRAARRGRAGLVLAEIAMAVVLVTGAVLMARSLAGLMATDLGFHVDRRLVVQLQPPSIDYPEGDDVEAFYRLLGERISGLPAIESVGRANSLPLEGATWTTSARFEGRDVETGEINRRIVDARYFSTLGVPLVEGRWFDERERPDGDPVVVVNETFARSYFPEGSPVGLRMTIEEEPEEDDWYTVIGVVGDEKLDGIASRPWPEFFLSMEQNPQRFVSVIARWAPGTDRPDRALQSVVEELDPNLPIASIRTLGEVATGTIGTERLLTTLLSAFGLLAMTLAGVGVGGLVARSVMQRRREIGVRLALGARPEEVVRMLIRDGLVPVTAGLALGLVMAVPIAVSLRSLLHGVPPVDPATLTAVVAGLGAVGALATWIPARRAARIDPALSLRTD